MVVIEETVATGRNVTFGLTECLTLLCDKRRIVDEVECIHLCAGSDNEYFVAKLEAVFLAFLDGDSLNDSVFVKTEGSGVFCRSLGRLCAVDGVVDLSTFGGCCQRDVFVGAEDVGLACESELVLVTGVNEEVGFDNGEGYLLVVGLAFCSDVDIEYAAFLRGYECHRTVSVVGVPLLCCACISFENSALVDLTGLTRVGVTLCARESL